LKPTIIIAHTVKGKGVSFMEHVVDFHGRAPTEKEREIALRELEEIEKDEDVL
jgi:transketolase